MGKEQFKEHLMKFDLTRQEAAVYESLLENGKLTGYEAAKLTGISRSNVYVALASLCEKGAAYLEASENGKRYLSVPVQEFCEDKIDQLKKEEDWLVMHAPVRKEEEEGYITISGQETIEAKARALLKRAKVCRRWKKGRHYYGLGSVCRPWEGILHCRQERTDGNDCRFLLYSERRI